MLFQGLRLVERGVSQLGPAWGPTWPVNLSTRPSVTVLNSRWLYPQSLCCLQSAGESCEQQHKHPFRSALSSHNKTSVFRGIYWHHKLLCALQRPISKIRCMTLQSSKDLKFDVAQAIKRIFLSAGKLAVTSTFQSCYWWVLTNTMLIGNLERTSMSLCVEMKRPPHPLDCLGSAVGCQDDMVILTWLSWPQQAAWLTFFFSSHSDYPAAFVLCYDQTIQPSWKNVLLKALCGSCSQLDLYNGK